MAFSIRIALLAASLLLLADGAHAEASPVGLWKTVDDDSGQPKALVRIGEERGSLSARIVRLLDPSDSADARCEACPDERRDQPVVGLVIMRNVRPLATTPPTWGGGDILDPEDGRIYKVHLKLDPDNRKLEVRGYIGAPLFGRSQTWLRVE